MKIPLTILFCILSLSSFCNMASPVIRGTAVAAPFTSRDIDIIKEVFNIHINSAFTKAHFSVDYFIKTGTAGNQVPLLFYAEGYDGAFVVEVDSNPVSLKDIPAEYLTNESSLRRGFTKPFTDSISGDKYVEIEWADRAKYLCKLKDLQYFEAGLSKGTHRIHVEYDAKPWGDRHGWIMQYSFAYSLSPAKYWKSFGTLDIVLNIDSANNNINTNLGTPATGSTPAHSAWHFNGLPAETVLVNFTPKAGRLATLLLCFKPAGLTVIVSMVLITLHIAAMRRHYLKRAVSTYSPALVPGSVLIPLFLLLFYVESFDIIDSAIGQYASRYHGYIFVAVFLYLIIMPCYWGVMRIVDGVLKRRLTKKQGSPIKGRLS